MSAYLGADYLMNNIGSSGDESAGGYNGAEGTEGYNPENHTVAGYDGGANTTNAMVGGGMVGISGMDMGMMSAEVGADALTGNMGNKAKTTPKPKTRKPKPKKVKSKGFFGGIKDYTSKAVSNVKGVASSAYHSTKGAASSAYNSTKGAVSTAYQGAKTFAQPALEYTGRAVNKVKDVAMSAADITKQAKEWMGKKITGITPKLLKGIKKPLRGVLSKIPLVGAILEGIFTKMDVDSIVADGGYENKQDMFSEMGNSVISGGLGLTMGSLAAGAVSSLQAVGIPGWLLAGAAYMGGDFLGRLIGDAISDHVGGPLLGKAIFDTFYGGGGDADAMQVPESGEITELATGGIVTGPTNAIVGEAGPEAVIPLREFYAKFDQLIDAVNKGGNVYLDGNKVGYSLALQSSQM